MWLVACWAAEADVVVGAVLAAAALAETAVVAVVAFQGLNHKFNKVLLWPKQNNQNILYKNQI